MRTDPNDLPEPELPRVARVFVALAAVLGVAIIAALIGTALLALPMRVPGASAALLAGGPDLCAAVDDAYLSGVVYGAVERTIEWRGTDMSCEGGPRPDGDGLRLVFAAPVDARGARLVFVVAIAGPIDGMTSNERAVNVTVIDESTARFYSSAGQERCWTSVDSLVRYDDRLRLGGELYCSGSLPSVSDGSSITLGDFRYSGSLVPDET